MTFDIDDYNKQEFIIWARDQGLDVSEGAHGFGFIDPKTCEDYKVWKESAKKNAFIWEAKTKHCCFCLAPFKYIDPEDMFKGVQCDCTIDSYHRIED